MSQSYENCFLDYMICYHAHENDIQYPLTVVTVHYLIFSFGANNINYRWGILVIFHMCEQIIECKQQFFNLIGIHKQVHSSTITRVSSSRVCLGENFREF